MSSSFDFDKPVTRDDVENLFRIILGRPVGNEEFKREVEESRVTVRSFARRLLESEEFFQSFKSHLHLRPEDGRHSVAPYLYRVPIEMQRRSLEVKSVLLIGSCLMDRWTDNINAYNAKHSYNTQIQKILFNNGSKLPEMDLSGRPYDFVIVQVPLRSIMPEASYLELAFLDQAAYAECFRAACERLDFNLERAREYNSDYGLTTFVLNFLTPQQNPAGRLLPRYSLNNMVYFIEELNRHLWNACNKRKEVYVIDFEQIVNTYGKRSFQDDAVVHLNHGSLLGNIAMAGDERRLEPVGDVEEIYVTKTAEIITASYHEILSAYGTIRQNDIIKLVIFDLDDTLWRGVAAEMEGVGSNLTEGWPLGILEAASYLWRRGVLIAIASKNDESKVIKIWEELYESRFSLRNFAVKQINWEPKVEGVRKILESLNLLPQNVLFVDDNPVERAAVSARFPEMRVLSAQVAYWRRILLWSAELQCAVVSEESSRRTEMVQAQIERDQTKGAMDQQAFLRSLHVKMDLSKISNASHRRFERCYELLNKTNQFNTTGKRWSVVEIGEFFATGGYMIAADVKDKFTPYGLVGLVLVRDDTLEQCVLSCRVFGLGVEQAMLDAVLASLGPTMPARAKLSSTGKNGPCLSVYRDAGFRAAGEGLWTILPSDRPAVAGHVEVTWEM